MEDIISMAKSKLCRFAPRDYIALSSALSLAIAEELDDDELKVLIAFFAVVADQLTLIATARSLCSAGDSGDITTGVTDPTSPLNVSEEIAADKINRKKVKKKKPKAPTS